MRSISGLFLMAVIAVPAVVYQVGEMNAFELHSVVVETPSERNVNSNKEDVISQLPPKINSDPQTLAEEKLVVQSLEKFEIPEVEQSLDQRKVSLTPLQRINDMPAEDWLEIKGIGQVTAERILSYRNAQGGFSSLDELLEVKGIGPAKHAAIVEWLEQQK